MTINTMTSLFEDQVEDSAEKVLRVKLEDIIAKDQVRTNFTALAGLGKSLRRQQDHPIILSPKNEDGKYTIQKGGRRYKAAQLEGLETIQAIVRANPVDSNDETIGQLAENIQRENLNAVEIGNALLKLKESGMKQDDIANELGKSKTWVSSFLAITKLPDDIMELAIEDIVSDKDTLIGFGKIYDIDKDLAQHLITIARDEGVTRKQILDQLKILKEVGNESKGEDEGEYTDTDIEVDGLGTEEENLALDLEGDELEGDNLESNDPGSDDDSNLTDDTLEKNKVDICKDEEGSEDSKRGSAETSKTAVIDKVEVFVTYNGDEGSLDLEKESDEEGKVWILVDGLSIETNANEVTILRVTHG